MLAQEHFDTIENYIKTDHDNLTTAQVPHQTDPSLPWLNYALFRTRIRRLTCRHFRIVSVPNLQRIHARNHQYAWVLCICGCSFKPCPSWQQTQNASNVDPAMVVIRLRFRLVVVDACMRHTSLTTEQENFRVKKIQLTLRWNTIRILPEKKWWWNVTYFIVHGTLRSRNGLAMRLVIGHAIDSLKDPRRELAIEFCSNIAIGLQRPCDGPPMVL